MYFPSEVRAVTVSRTRDCAGTSVGGDGCRGGDGSDC